MITAISLQKRNSILKSMAQLVADNQQKIIAINNQEVLDYQGNDLSMQERLKVDSKIISSMIGCLQQLISENDPIGLERFSFVHENGMKVSNQTVPFGTILIIFESRPDVVVEAAAIALKSGNKILLKGGKEALKTNLILVELWHKAFIDNQTATDWISYLNFDRTQTQNFLVNPSQKIDLIVPRGGETLITFVKKHATCPVIVSGRGNNFVYIHTDADFDMAIEIIVNAKTSKISACNATDKVLIDENLPNFNNFLEKLTKQLKLFHVEILIDDTIPENHNYTKIESTNVWSEEFLDYKILIGKTSDIASAINKINKHCGGHSATIISNSADSAQLFMKNVDAAAVYHNASTRFTDGGQLGLGAELAISTDKLHHRGPLGLQQLVTNKWFIYGNGQVR